MPHVIPTDDTSLASASVPTNDPAFPPTGDLPIVLGDCDDVSVTSVPTSTNPSQSSEAVSDDSPNPETPITDAELSTNTAQPLTSQNLSLIHHNPSTLPLVPPSTTPAPCESRTSFDSLCLYKIFGCRKFRNQQHVTDAANAHLINTGPLPPTLGSFATIPNPPSGKSLRRRRKFLDKVHLDIVFGDCVGLGGFRYAILLVDVATRYCWVYGLTSLTSSEVIHAFEQFRADAGGVPKRFHADFDKKLIGGKALRWILSNKSNIIAAPAGRQSSNGLAERTWRTIITMSRAYITEK